MTDIIQLHAHRAILGEGPTWRPKENAVYWIDLRAPAIFRYDCASGRNETLPVQLGDRLGAIVFTTDGRMVAADRSGLHLIERGQRRGLSHPDADQPLNCFNDAKVDRRGRLWSGGADTKDTDANGSLWVFDAKANARKIDSGFICANGHCAEPCSGAYSLTCPDHRPSSVTGFACCNPNGAPGGVICCEPDHDVCNAPINCD